MNQQPLTPSPQMRLSMAPMAPAASLAPRSNRLTALASLISTSETPLTLVRAGGTVSAINADRVQVSGLARAAKLGSFVEIDSDGGPCLGEVIAIAPEGTTIKLLSSAHQLGIGTHAWLRDALAIRPDRSWQGRVINALGVPIDGGPALTAGAKAYRVEGQPPSPLSLERVRQPCLTGIRAIDLFTPLCKGQRIGIFAGSGVGKSTLVSMLGRSAGFKVLVVALVAERGREVREFIEDVIGPSGARAITVVATSAESPMMRKLAAKTAVTIAEAFRDNGDDVLLMVDSITRYAHALREVALAAGELPVARGYTPSVFADLPRLLERAGPGLSATGSITGVFSVLVDGDDHNEPIADAVRGILDGHIVLDRAIAEQGRYPAINPLVSISRLAGHVWTREEAALVRRLRALIARYEETRELRSLGAYKGGTDPELDQAVAVAPILYRLLTQLPEDPPSRRIFDELAVALAELKAAATTTPPAAQRAPLAEETAGSRPTSAKGAA